MVSGSAFFVSDSLLVDSALPFFHLLPLACRHSTSAWLSATLRYPNQHADEWHRRATYPRSRRKRPRRIRNRTAADNKRTHSTSARESVAARSRGAKAKVETVELRAAEFRPEVVQGWLVATQRPLPATQFSPGSARRYSDAPRIRRPIWPRVCQAKDPSASVTIAFHSNDFRTKLMGLGRS
jgi:hypothetical protein